MTSRNRQLVSTEIKSWLPIQSPIPTRLNPTAWFDASNTSTITQSSNAVSQWNDLSGNGYHLTQATAANQPTTNSATINGLNVLQFDGTNDSMVNTSIPASGPTHTYVIVAKESASITVTKSLLNGGVVAAGQALAFYLTGTAPNRQTNIFSSAATAGQKFTTTNANVIYVKNDWASSEFGINKTFASATIASYPRPAGLRVGATENGTAEWFNGQIAEVLYFNKTLSNSERDLLIGYLTDKWGL